jgi:glycolate oxidase
MDGQAYRDPAPRCAEAAGSPGQADAVRDGGVIESFWEVATDVANTVDSIPARRVLTEDVCVPRAAVPEMLARIERTGVRHNTLVANIAHAGDGNLPPLIITPPGDEAARARAQSAFEDILDDAIALGGTVTGEHGVGLLKMRGMNKELRPAVLGMHHAVTAALDPHGVLNPGKVLGAGPGVSA